MTSEIVSNLRSKPQHRKYAHALSYVVGGLLFEAGKNDVNPLKPAINVEDLFNAVRLLAERSTLEAAPFIGSWHYFLDDLDRVYPSQTFGNLQRLISDLVVNEIKNAFAERPPAFASDRIDRAIASKIESAVRAAMPGRFHGSTFSESVGAAVKGFLEASILQWSNSARASSLSRSNEIEAEIDKQIKSSRSRSGKGRVFDRTTKLMIAALKDLVWIEDANKVVYLSPILNLLEKQERLVIATLNYDNTVELLASSQGFSCNTGISSWSANGRFDLSSPGLHLLKLHGSIDWLRNERQRTNQMPAIEILQMEPERVKQQEFSPAVIFGNRNKLTAEGPFLDLLRSFQDELAKSQTLTVVGYSFRDPHINVYVSQWLNADANRLLRVVNGRNFHPRMRLSSDTPPYVRELLEFSVANPERVKFLGDYAGDGLRLLYGERNFVRTPPNRNTNEAALERMENDSAPEE